MQSPLRISLCLRSNGRRMTRCRTTKRWASEDLKGEPEPSSSDLRSPASRVSIPGPSWLWTSIQPLTTPFRAYGRAAKNKPYTTQFLSSLAIYFLGDLSSQYIHQRSENPQDPARALVDHYDPIRAARSLCIGGAFSIPSYHWFIYLSTHFDVPATWPLSKILSLAYKVAINQAFFAPIFNTYFFGMQSILSGDGGPTDTSPESSLKEVVALDGRLNAAWSRVRETVPISWYNSCKFWPFVTAFSFTFIPLRQRSVFAGLAAIGWQSYLGIVNQQAVDRERLESLATA